GCPHPNLVFVINTTQYKVVHHLFDKYNIRVVSKLYNSVHRNILYLCVWEANPERNPTNPRFMAHIFEEKDNKDRDNTLGVKDGVKKEDIPFEAVPWFLPQELRDWKKNKEKAQKTPSVKPKVPTNIPKA